MSLEPLLSVEEVARILKMSPAWVRQHSNGLRSLRFRPSNSGSPCASGGRACAPSLMGKVAPWRKGRHWPPSFGYTNDSRS
jgi:hypothetical protein